MWLSETHTGYEYVMSAQRSESVFKLWKEARVPGEKNHSGLARNRQPKTDIAHAIGLLSWTNFCKSWHTIYLQGRELEGYIAS